jgi:hypothetical protein
MDLLTICIRILLEFVVVPWVPEEDMDLGRTFASVLFLDAGN